jgi:hypothetical protein
MTGRGPFGLGMSTSGSLLRRKFGSPFAIILGKPSFLPFSGREQSARGSYPSIEVALFSRSGVHSILH